MYNTALVAASQYHFFKPKTPGDQDILFTGKVEAGDPPTLITEVQHLGCFVGGMVGLGSRINNSPSELEMAIRLSNSCYWAYTNTASGIMPEIFYVDHCPTDGSSCTWTDESKTGLGHQYGFTRVDDTSYQLRPEAIESIFIMWRITGDPEWMEKGWRMWKAISKHTRTEIANARLSDVTTENPKKEDSMESFWLAETLKYFYLLFSETGTVNLDEFVLWVPLPYDCLRKISDTTAALGLIGTETRKHIHSDSKIIC
jgi:mannosyl-oligosaccharide alpha-1,2-mannosidase